MRLKTSPSSPRINSTQSRWKTLLLSGVVIGGVISQSPLVQQKPTASLNPPSESKSSLKRSSFTRLKGTKEDTIIPTVEYDVDGNCKALPFIRPAGTYFLNADIQPAPSPEAVTPAFHVGSFLANKVTHHMLGDIPHFELIKELLEGKEGGLTLDIGANQGFYTYYLAALGMEVHAFEIQEANFVSLQHGAEYNPKEVAEQVFVYPVGLGTRTGRMSMGGSTYDGHLKGIVGLNDGTIQTTSVDCFVYQNIQNLGNDLLSNVAFVKIDVEGFEIAVLQGARQSLFGPQGHVGGLIMEVGPSRWNRAFVSFNIGVQEMKKVAGHFQQSYILVRTSGTFVQSCPTSLVKGVIQDTNPRVLEGAEMYKMEMDEWEPVLSKLNEIEGDCNFWYIN
ncbi:unnamed protein product [Cylindrotheca closterium]|uniref:Methyltransferase FkbM domain-containing protein n=1 Tax=Cylindrotheca closterium TaxID=2856 RepID=A0AAD2FGW7_9STRA|nr:unnamed protein product [Cylindrotheca closterium]